MRTGYEMSSRRIRTARSQAQREYAQTDSTERGFKRWNDMRRVTFTITEARAR